MCIAGVMSEVRRACAGMKFERIGGDFDPMVFSIALPTLRSLAEKTRCSAA
jgi:hypothetical protein